MRKRAATPIGLDQISAGTAAAEQLVLLRALSWCYMAYAEYVRDADAGADVDATAGKRLRDADTCERLTEYLEGLDDLIS